MGIVRFITEGAAPSPVLAAKMEGLVGTAERICDVDEFGGDRGANYAQSNDQGENDDRSNQD
ncbi:MAG: hypothetical protein HY000_39070 [Planctomycetes bacterium]|nr:hypothetical protein [Planctomycetota bacterium]